MDPAKRHPDVRFDLCHAGLAVYTDEAIAADNIVLESSWCPTYTVSKMIHVARIDCYYGVGPFEQPPGRVDEISLLGTDRRSIEENF
jgi:hypothetical protein